MQKVMIIVVLLCSGIIVGCESTGHTDEAAIQQAKWHVPLAYLDGHPVRRSDIDDLLIEAAGGRVFAEYALNQMVARELKRRGLVLQAEHIAREKQQLLRLLDDDLAVAAELMTIQRQQQGPLRFDGFIVRQAGLRLLVQDDVEISPAAVRQAFELRYGPRYQVRIIMVETLAQAGVAAARINDGEPFMDVAIDVSTDPSGAQGGLLSPISLADPTYPVSLKDEIRKLGVGQMSRPVLLENGYAVVKLERVIDGQGVKLDAVKAELETVVRRQSEQILIQRMARMMLQEADLQIHDPGLKRSWGMQLEGVLAE